MPIKTTVKNPTRAWVDRFAEWCDTDLYREYREALRDEREMIIEEGKLSRDPHVLSVLKGFDMASSFFERQKMQLHKSRIQQEEDDIDAPDF